jgi:tetratricopeptide (TPR) repeat protein
MTENPDNLDTAKADYHVGKMAFERGDYRKSVNALEKANASINPNSSLGGEVQSWLVMAYEAAGQREAAIALCRQLTNHPNLKTRKEGRRLLYILEAPQLKTRPEWLTQIPDLTNLSEADPKNRIGASSGGSTSSRPAPKPKAVPEPVDLSQVNTEDNRFVWIALLGVLLIVGGLIWLA